MADLGRMCRAIGRWLPILSLGLVLIGFAWWLPDSTGERLASPEERLSRARGRGATAGPGAGWGGSPPAAVSEDALLAVSGAASRLRANLRPGQPASSLWSSLTLDGEALATVESDLLRLRDLRLEIDPAEFAFVFSQPPATLFAVHRARVQLDGTGRYQRVGFRGRGAHAWHWRPQKPSFRLRVGAGRSLWGRRVIDAINPEDAPMIANVLADHVAWLFGVPASVTRMGCVWLNDRFLGVYHLTDRIDGALLARAGYGDWPVAEGNRRTVDMWGNHELWEVHGGPMVYRDRCRPALERLLGLVRPPLSWSRVGRVARLLDLPATAAWSAAMTIVGSLQADDTHGQHLAWPPATGQFQPILADATGFGILNRHGLDPASDSVAVWPYEFLTPLLDAAFRNPYFVARRNRLIWQGLAGPASPERLQRLAADLHRVASAAIAADRHRGALINVPHLGVPIRLPISAATVASQVAQLQDWVAARARFLRQRLGEVQVTVTELEGPVTPLEAGEVRDHPGAPGSDPTPGTTDPASIGTVGSADGRSAGGSSGASRWSPRHRLLIEVTGHAPVVFSLGSTAAAVGCDFDLDGYPDPGRSPPPTDWQLYPALLPGQAAGQPWLRVDQRLLPYVLQPATHTYLIDVDSGRREALRRALAAGATNGLSGAPVPVRFAAAAGGLPAPADLPAWLRDRYWQGATLHPWAVAPGDLVDREGLQ